MFSYFLVKIFTAVNRILTALTDTLSTVSGVEVKPTLEAGNLFVLPSIWATILMAEMPIDHGRVATVTAAGQTNFVTVLVVRSLH